MPPRLVQTGCVSPSVLEMAGSFRGTFRLIHPRNGSTSQHLTAAVDGMHKVAYSSDGTTIYAHWRKDDERSFQSFNAETGEVGFSVGKDS
jgi:hypothetical protein